MTIVEEIKVKAFAKASAENGEVVGADYSKLAEFAAKKGDAAKAEKAEEAEA
jgi:hypothetical protein